MSKDLLSEIEDAVIEEMRDSVLLCSWADYANEHHLTKPGGTYEETMPDAIRVDFRIGGISTWQPRCMPRSNSSGSRRHSR
jgi:hypothetical protein